jgi:hypothetical protein
MRPILYTLDEHGTPVPLRSGNRHEVLRWASGQLFARLSRLVERRYADNRETRSERASLVTFYEKSDSTPYCSRNNSQLVWPHRIMRRRYHLVLLQHKIRDSFRPRLGTHLWPSDGRRRP